MPPVDGSTIQLGLLPTAPDTGRAPTAAVAIGLNEAGLDSPSFRATAAHVSDQVDAIEKWLENYVKATAKASGDVLTVEDSINTYLNRLVPTPGTADTIIDHDYTYLALKRTAEASREWWMQLLGMMRRMDSLVVQPIRSFMLSELRAFKDARRTLETTQKTYDSILSRYVAQSKAKEPSSLREDAFAVYEARKPYLKASLDFCQLAPLLRYSLDKVLIRVCSGVWGELKRSRDNPGTLGKWGSEVDRIRGWSREMEASEAVFTRELQTARRQIGERTMHAIRPSRELDDYSTSTVPFLTGPASARRREGADKKGALNTKAAAVMSEKQGWLFLRTLSGKPVRTTWVRRWYYCRDGVFGWLVQGPSGVLQGDDIGVLLCNAKPAVSEDRRFCFEVKTGAQTMMLQTETQTELTEWLDVFDVARQLAFEATEAKTGATPSGQVDPAFSITPAAISDLSAKSLDAHLSSLEDVCTTLERTGTLPLPHSDISRSSLDVSNTGTRRSLAALGRDLAREDGESSRDHAARIIQNWHRKTTFVAGVDGGGAGTGGGAGAGAGSGAVGAIAALLSPTHNLLPASQGPTAQNAAAAAAAVRGGSLSLPLIEPSPAALAPPTLARPPAPTPLSRTAVIATAERGLGRDKSLAMQSSLMANYWGSNIWAPLDPSHASDASAEVDDDGEPIEVVVSDQGKTVVRGGQCAETFPPSYPAELRAQHAQFRILFPKVPLEEKLVLVARAAWLLSNDKDSSDGGDNNKTPKNKKSLISANGRLYFTADNLYFYGHHLGLISTMSISLDLVTEVASRQGQDSDVLFLHLRQEQPGSESAPSLLTIKTFLEDPQLLHARLNLLVDDLQSEEPMELLEIINALVNLGHEGIEKASPSAESWDEMSSSTPFDSGMLGGHELKVPRREHRGGRRWADRPRPPINPAKVQLPALPVVYEPDDMAEVVCERHFEISAKACFHVLFGDKSFVFPKLYFERRAQQIAQGPWTLADHGKMRREFEFAVERADMLGRSSKGKVIDFQAIDVFSDHVTYVVTHTKTAWHLPHSQAFRLVTKIVITHVAKSKCRLALYVKVEWSKPPRLARWLVERQALDDGRSDAEELAEVATDQVRKLGPHSRTKRAIQVYGHIGQQKQVVLLTPNESRGSRGQKQAVKTRTLAAMVFDTVRSVAESCLTTLIMWAFAALKNLVGVLSAHRLLLLFLGFSALTNVLLTSRASSAWLAERRAAGYMNRLGVGPNAVMSKAIYLADLDEVTGAIGLSGAAGATGAAGAAAGQARPSSSAAYQPGDGQCFATWQALAAGADLDTPPESASAGLSSGTSRATARRLRSTRQRLGSYRHDLIVAMRVVNSIEKETVRSEWENWLGDENARCESLREALEWRTAADAEVSSSKQQQKKQQKKHEQKRHGWERLGAMEQDEITNLRQWYEDYCGSCRQDLWGLMAERKGGLLADKL